MTPQPRRCRSARAVAAGRHRPPLGRPVWRHDHDHRHRHAARTSHPRRRGRYAASARRRPAQRHGDALGGSTLVGPGGDLHSIAQCLTVAKGDRIYFHTSSRSDGTGDDVEWDPASPTRTFSSAPSLDANGLRQDRLRGRSDFTLAGRPGSVVTLDTAGTATHGRVRKGTRLQTTYNRGCSCCQVAPDPSSADVEIVPHDADRYGRRRSGEDRDRDQRRMVRQGPVRRRFGCFRDRGGGRGAVRVPRTVRGRTVQV